MLDTPAQIKHHAPRIQIRAVDQQNMPFNNKTGMTAAERGELGRWIADGAQLAPAAPATLATPPGAPIR